MIILLTLAALQKVEVVGVRDADAVVLGSNAKYNTLRAAKGHGFRVVRVRVDREAATGKPDGSSFEIRPNDFALLDEKGEVIRHENWIAWMEAMTSGGYSVSANECEYVDDDKAVYDEAFGSGAAGNVALKKGTLTIEVKGLAADLKTLDFEVAFLVATGTKADAVKFRDFDAAKVEK